MQALIQELCEELKAKLDEVLARLASTGVDGDHYEKDYATGQYVLYPRTFATDVSQQMGLCRHPWQAAYQH
eukprot:264063-Amphidinium_carterae.1